MARDAAPFLGKVHRTVKYRHPFFHGWIPENYEKARRCWRGETRLGEDISYLENDYG